MLVEGGEGLVITTLSCPLPFVLMRRDDDRLVVVGLSPELPLGPCIGRPVGKAVLSSLVGVEVGVDRPEDGGELNEEDE